ncbi:MAG: helix-turn-helix domain-containing protein [Paludibacter sp.]|nr:helix-turn-helix domain-containing protein [Paludibacter sp.]
MKNITKILLPFVCLVISGVNSFAYNLKQITNNYNLSNSSITDFCQDDKGVVFIGTCDGLNIYNSRDVEAFQPDNKNTFLSGNIIDKIVYTGDNTFWIQTYYGLNKFNAGTNTVTHFNEFQKLFFIEKDKSNNLFIISESNSIFYYQKGNSGFKKLLTSGIIFSDIEKFFIDSHDILWIITNKGYNLTYKIVNKNDELSLIPVKNKLNFSKKIINCFYDDDDTIYYIDTDYDLFSYNVVSYKKTYIYNLKDEILKRGKVSAIIRHHDNYFIGFLTNGLLLLEKQEDTYLKKEIEVNSGIFCLKRDKLQDIVWIGTDGKGVYIFSNTAYSIRSNVLNNLINKIERPVRALFLDNQNTLWIGSKGDGILKVYDYNVNKSIHDCRIEAISTKNSQLSDNIIYAFRKSNRNILWIGSEEGLNFYSYKTKQIKQVKINIKGLDYRYIHDIYETADSKLWLASVGLGIVCADITDSDDNPTLTNIRHYTINNGDFESNYFFSIYAETDSSIWFANRGYGPFHFNNKNENLDPVNFYNKYSNQTINDVFVINKDDSGNMLFGTGYGLIKYTNPEEHKIFNSYTGFLNNSIHAIVKEDNNTFWLSTNKGIVQFNSKREGFRIFDKIDGLKVTEFSDGASFRDNQSGTIFFGGVNGFVSIQKDRGTEQTYMPGIYFDKLTIFGEHHNISENINNYRGSSRLELKYKQNFFAVSFTAIDYINGGNYTYYYKIDGLSDQWINNGTANVASFTNISPGNYTLLVKYYNRTLEKESPVYSLKIKIFPPWYLSGWAYLIYILISISIIIMVIRYYIQKQKRRKQELVNELEKKHQKEVFESKLRFFTNIAHEFCTPLTLISGPCERILAQQGITKFVANYVQMIQTNAERLNGLIQELIEFRRIETGNRELVIEELNISDMLEKILAMFSNMAESKQIGIEFSPEQTIKWNSDKGFLTTIITNLISNAFKYTPNNKKIRVTLSVSDNYLAIAIANQGNAIKKIDSKRVFDRYTILDNFENQENNQTFSRNGLGLAISYNMVKLLNGSIEISTTCDDFVLFTVKLPFIKMDAKTVHQDQTIQTTRTYIPEIIQHKTIKLPKYDFNKLKPTMLIVDDDIEILWLIGEIFSDEFNIIPLNDPLELDSILNDVFPNIIISDIMMNGMNGVELTQKIKSRAETDHIPVILISGKYEIEQQIEALEAGAEMYINKPFNTKYLKISVQQIIERKEKLKNYFSSPISSYEMAEGKLTHTEHKKFLQSVLNIINENITNKDLSTQFIADQLGIGSRSLYRKMQEVGDESLASLIKECRLHLATDLLLKTKMTIDEVVYKSGFSNKVTFFKAFHKKYNCTPKEFRTKNEADITSTYNN